MGIEKIKLKCLVTIGLMVIILGIIYLLFVENIQLLHLLYFIKYFTKNIGILLIFIIASFGFGFWTIKFLGGKDITDPWFYIYSLAIGFGVLAHIGLFGGLIGLYTKLFSWFLIIFGDLLFIFFIIKHRGQFIQFRRKLRTPQHINLALVLFAIFIFYCWLFPLITYALVPPIMSDEVAYHMAIPKIFTEHQGINFISYIPYSNWPLETEILFTISLLLPSEILPHLTCWIDLILLCIVIYKFCHQYLGGFSGIIAVAIFTSTPMVLHLSGTGLIELPLALYSTLAILAFIKWLNDKHNIELTFSAIFGGLAACTKLNGAFVPLLIGIVYLLFMISQKKLPIRKIIFPFVRYGLIAFLVVAPWYIKTWIFTGNPFWPIFGEIFGYFNWDALGNEYLFGFIQLPNLPISFGNWIYAFIELTIHANKYGPYGIFLGSLYLSLLPFSIILVIFRKSNSTRILIWIGGLFLLFYTSWFLQTHQARFLLPILPILAIFIGGSFDIFSSLLRFKWFSYLCTFIVLSVMVFLSWGTHSIDRNLFISRWPFLSGQINRNTFLSNVISGYETYSFANKTLPPKAYVWLALYEVRGYYLDRKYMWANPISQRDFKLENFSKSDDLAKELHVRGITHIIFNTNKIDQYKHIRYGPQITQLTFELINNHTRLLYKSDEVELYKLIP